MIREFFSPRVFIVFVLLWILLWGTMKVWRLAGPQMQLRVLKGISGIAVTGLLACSVMFGILLLN